MNGITGRRRAPALLGGIAGLVLASAAWGQTTPDGRAPPFAQLLRDSASSPRVAALDADVERAEGLAQQAGARPNPTISVYGENIAGGAPYDGLGRAETTVQVNQPIEIGGKRAARVAAGRAGVVAARATNLVARLAYASDLARAYGAADVADRRITLAEDEVEEATADLKVARALVIAGKEARLRQLQAETELNTLTSELETARAHRAAALARLAGLAGIATPFTGLSESLLDRVATRPPNGPPDPLHGIAVRAAEAEREAATRRAAVQRKAAIPDVTAQVGVRRLELDNATALVAGISLPLNLFDRNKGNIAAADAEARGAEAHAAAVRIEAQANAHAAQILAAAADARTAAATRTMATAQETYRLARIAYEAGKSPLIELLAARHGLGVARAVVLDAAAARLDARVALASAHGLTLTGDPVQ